jgi:hypothetical protein
MRLATYATYLIQLGIKGSLILNQNHCPVQCSLERYFQRERDYYSTNLSILNISSYRDLNLFGMLNPANTRNYDAIQIINPQIFVDCFLAGPPISIYYPFRTFSIPWLWIFHFCIKSNHSKFFLLSLLLRLTQWLLKVTKGNCYGKDRLILLPLSANVTYEESFKLGDYSSELKDFRSLKQVYITKYPLIFLCVPLLPTSSEYTRIPISDDL